MFVGITGVAIGAALVLFAPAEPSGGARAVPPRPSVVASIAIIALGTCVAALMIGFRL